jgi:hypothetical protein
MEGDFISFDLGKNTNKISLKDGLFVDDDTSFESYGFILLSDNTVRTFKTSYDNN